VSHFQKPAKSDEWYTPPSVFQALGEYFDLDVASPGPTVTPWVPADFVYTSDSLERPWFGFVWMNPPFGGRNGYLPWARKFVAHGNGIALSPVSTGAAWCQELLHGSDAVLLWSPKIKFIAGEGQDSSDPTFASMLCAAGSRAVEALRRAASNGVLLSRV
jgi:hypothetical protein